MNTKTTLGLLALGAGIVGSFTALPAQAFSFSTSGIEVQGTLDLTFTAAVGGYQSSLNLYKLDANGAPQLVTPNIFQETASGIPSTVTPSTTQITLTAGTYAFGITIPNQNYGGFNGSNDSAGDVIFSSTALNNGIFAGQTTQQAVFGRVGTMNITGATSGTIGQSDGTSFASLNSGGAAAFTGASLTAADLALGVMIGFDDTGANFDSDYNDFVFTIQGNVNAGGAQPVPEPTTIAGMLLAGAGLLYGRKKMKKVSHS